MSIGPTQPDPNRAERIMARVIKLKDIYRPRVLLALALTRVRFWRDELTARFGKKKKIRMLNDPAVNGVPPGIDWELINQICKERFENPVRKMSFRHLSGWKETGAYRIYLTLENGRTTNLVYKNAIYDELQIPALTGLPIQPGLPEYVVYENFGASGVEILPKIYHIQEIIPGKHYQYLLEDLSTEYRYIMTLQDKVRLAKQIPAISRRLCQEKSLFHFDQLIEYNTNYSLSLQKYALASLERYVAERNDEEVTRFLTQWLQISKVHAASEFHEMGETCLIHGDLNFTNVFLQRSNPDKIKLIDWEWTGYGQMHADLASLLKGSPDWAEETVLASISMENPTLNFEQHSRLYYWCKLERNLLDASFLAAQDLGNDYIGHFSLPAFIHNSLHQVCDAYDKLG